MRGRLTARRSGLGSAGSGAASVCLFLGIVCCATDGATTGSGKGPTPLSQSNDGVETGGVSEQGETGTTGACADATVQSVISLTNAERAARGLSPFACHSVASDVARSHSLDMCEHGTLSHDSSDGTHFDERLSAAGVQFGGAGENVAQGAATAANVIAMWMASSGHRANILSTEFTHIGVGYAPCEGAHYWTQVFFAP